MLQIMYSLMNLAAVQIGLFKEINLLIFSENEKNPFLINPKITFKSKRRSIYEEGAILPVILQK